MISAQQLADSFALNFRIIKMQSEGLSHEDSLIQTQYNINCLNWVLGHIAVGRDGLLKLLGEAPILSDEHTARYQSGAEPISGDEEGVIPLEDLIEILGLGQRCERMPVPFRLSIPTGPPPIVSGPAIIAAPRRILEVHPEQMIVQTIAEVPVRASEVSCQFRTHRSRAIDLDR